MKSNKFWVAVLGGVLIVSAIAAFLLGRQVPADKALVFHNGVLVESLDISLLQGSYTFTVENGAGVNVIEAERGRVRVSESNCPDGLCIRQGWIGGGAIPIVCLPHRLVIRFEGANEPDLDAVTGA